MSGPKVFRVITLEERMAPSLKLLSSLRAAIERLEREERLSEEDASPFRRRLEKLEESVAKANDFAKLERDIAAETAFVQSRRQEILEEKSKKLLLARVRSYSDDFKREILGRQLEFEAKLEDAETPKALTGYQKAILEDLLGSKEAGGVKAWSAGALQNQAGLERASRLERTMAELEALHPPTAKIFEGRLSDLGELPKGAKRSMLLDSLALDLSAAAKECRELAKAIEDLEDAWALADFGSEAASAVKEAIGKRSLFEIERLRLQLESALNSAEEKDFAALRRQRLLEGLSELGYAPGEEMRTMVGDGGKLVLVASDDSSYGVEISSFPERAQARVVSFSATTGAEEDREAEVRWCERFARFRDKASQTGSAVIVEKASEPGETAVKKFNLETVRKDRTRAADPRPAAKARSW